MRRMKYPRGEMCIKRSWEKIRAGKKIGNRFLGRIGTFLPQGTKVLENQLQKQPRWLQLKCNPLGWNILHLIAFAITFRVAVSEGIVNLDLQTWLNLSFKTRRRLGSSCKVNSAQYLRLEIEPRGGMLDHSLKQISWFWIKLFSWINFIAASE